MTAPTRSYDLVALDMAGTTIDEGGLVYTVLADAVTQATGSAVPADLLQQWKGTSKEEAIAGLLAGLGEDTSAPHVAKVFDRFTELVTTAYRETPPTPIPGVLDTFETLRTAGVRIALQTGYSDTVAASILEGLGWRAGAEYDALVTSSMVAASRPAPYLVFRCLELTGVTDVRRVLVAGDTPNDLGAGTNAGAGFVVGVATGSFTLDHLAAEPHTHLIDSVATLATLL